jgi:protein SCO1/2
MKNVRIALWLLVAVALFALGAIAVTRPGLFGGGKTITAAAPGAPLGGAFRLVDQNGAAVTEEIFRGKPSVTLFGFTHCPDVCPTGLSEMSRWADELGADAEKIRFVFVTVDPDRDTSEAMREYLSAFSAPVIGVTGAPDAVLAMTKDYKIFSRKVPLDGGDYTMDHSAAMILQDANGNFAGTIAPDEPHATGLEKLKRLVAG